MLQDKRSVFPFPGMGDHCNCHFLQINFWIAFTYPSYNFTIIVIH